MFLNETCSGGTEVCLVIDHLGLCLKLLYLQVSKLGELLATVVKLAGEWLNLLVHDLMCSNVPTLCERLATDVTLVRAFAGMASFVCLMKR